jgi:hypothetical protein
VRKAKKRASRSRSEWLLEVQRWRQSGESGSAYALAHDLDAGTLAWWASRLKKEAGVRRFRRSKPAPSFLAVQVRESRALPVEGTFEVVLANGRLVRVSGDFDIERVSRLLVAAEGGSR